MLTHFRKMLFSIFILVIFHTVSATPSCGGIDYCINYSPDGCNSCGCDSETEGSNGWCTEMYCGPNTGNKCTVCMDGYHIKNSECIPSACNLPKKVGPCRALMPRYYYNNETETCDLFYYGGCHANDNNFITEESCLQFTEQCTTISDKTTTNAATACSDVAQCNMYSNGCAACVCSDTGDLMCDDVECEDLNEDLICIGCNDGFYLFDGQCVEQKECGGFLNCASYYDGCNTCMCSGWMSACTKRYCAKEDYDDAECSECEDGYILNDGLCEMDATYADLCALEPDSGPCEAAMNRYFYSSATGECLFFLYGGCEGNDNNFETELKCFQQCAALTRNNAAVFSLSFSAAIVVSSLVQLY